MSSSGAKVISITQGRRRADKSATRTDEWRLPELHGGVSASTGTLLSHLPRPFVLHQSVLAILVAREGKWEILERETGVDSRPRILSRISLPDLLLILKKSADSVADAVLAHTPQILQAPHPQARDRWQEERITLSPWKDFDIALLLREGTPCYAACLEPGVSIYVAEDVLHIVANLFDTSSAKSSSDPDPISPLAR